MLLAAIVSLLLAAAGRVIDRLRIARYGYRFLDVADTRGVLDRRRPRCRPR
jgi:hypothetical protein